NCKRGSGVMIFQGLQSHTVDSIKSLEGFDLCWVEEAQTITAYSLELLTPTIRKDGAEILFTYNPKRKDDPVFLLEQDQESKVVIHANYLDNPYCPQSIIDEAQAMKRKRYAKYKHIYLGHFGVSIGLIFDNVTQRMIREEEIKRLECLQGMDFGFSNDPTAFCQIYIDHGRKQIFVVEGFYQTRLMNSEIALKVKALLAHRHLTRCDSAEPKTIASLNAKGVRSLACEKGKDSIVAGIEFLLEYEIFVNAHLKDFMEEFDNYTWELDKMTGQPINKPIDEYNHFIDALRYSVSHLYKRRGKTGGVGKPKGI
ncbi:MAG: PBSX family phage terminase large subunit, partial [Caldisericia bacterium]|nr:PBSX family phage terminase large subunit [Caldisericia bacterium]